MKPRQRDGLLALVVTASLVVVTRLLSIPPGALVRPLPFAVGVGGALALELLMARFPARSARLWYRRDVQIAAVSLVLVGGAVGALLAGTWILAALFGGLTAYFVLLAMVLAGAVPGPETWFVDDE